MLHVKTIKSHENRFELELTLSLSLSAFLFSPFQLDLAEVKSKITSLRRFLICGGRIILDSGYVTLKAPGAVIAASATTLNHPSLAYPLRKYWLKYFPKQTEYNKFYYSYLLECFISQIKNASNSCKFIFCLFLLILKGTYVIFIVYYYFQEM